MTQPLRALLVEDVESDAELLLRELKRGGFDVVSERVDTEEAMRDALENRVWDVVVSDYTMPRFSAMRALKLLREQSLDLPFIIVSGTVEEITGVEAIRAGAHDFMPKGSYARLIPAIERELRDAALRQERTKMQEQLLLSDRMASVGTLAAGVAHEINNPLTVLMANMEFAVQDAEQLLSDLEATGPGAKNPAETAARLREVIEPLKFAQEASERVRSIVRDLKTFSRSEEEKKESLDVQKLLESSLRMAHNEIRHRAQLVRDYGQVPLVYGNEGRLSQVFLNLIVNAAQAITEGHADSNEIRITTRPADGGMVSVEVKDTGSGIAPTLISRIFDPFFTTKPVGVGTGLGLAICHRIIVSQGGTIHVESAPGKGSRFRVLLPAATEEPVAAPPSSLDAPKRRGLILIVDDEPALAAAARRMLASEHDVVIATSAQEALEQIRGGLSFDVILCDLMMPEVSGMDLYDHLRKSSPSSADRMVFMTGGAFTGRAAAFLDSLGAPHIEKPFSGRRLRSLLRERLSK